MPRPYSADLRERVVADCEAGLGRAAAARRYRVGERTVYRWLAEARDEGRRAAKPSAGGRGPVVAGTEDVLRELATGPLSDATRAEQAEAYAARTGRKLSPSALCRACRRQGLTRKKETLRADERDRDDVRGERAAFAARVRGVAPERLVFVDEAGVATDMARTHAGAPAVRCPAAAGAG